MGAAAVQNIGAYGAEIQEVIESVETYNQLTFEKRIFSREDCQYGYRDSYFKNEHNDPHIVTHVVLRLEKSPRPRLDYGDLRARLEGKEPTLEAIRDAVLATRAAKLPDPAQLGNAGSFFKNPVVDQATYERLLADNPSMPSYPMPDGGVKIPAGWLIEACGFKGQRHGNVGIYEKQALVLVNLGGAQGYEIALLAESIRTAVKERFGLELMPEVKYVG